MGLFSSSKTYYYSSTSSLYTEVPGYIDQTIRNAIAQNRNISQDISDNLLSSSGIRARSFYNFGKNTYVRGLPEGSTRIMAEGAYMTVEDIIADEEGSKVSMEIVISGDADGRFWAEEFISNNRGWDVSSNEVSNPPFTPSGGKTVYFQDAEIVNSTTVKVNYSYDDTNDVYSENISTPLIDIDEQYFYAVYYVLDNEGNPASNPSFWRYSVSDGTYPALNIATTSDGSPYYPVIPIREYSVDLTNPATRDEALYLSSKNALRILKLDIDEISDSVHGRHAGNPNWDDTKPDYWVDPDFEKVDHVYVTLAVSIDTDVDLSIEYMYRYFDYLRIANRQANNENGYSYWDGNRTNNTPPPYNVVDIRDTDYHMELKYYFIKRTLRTGNVTKVGSYKRVYALSAPTIAGRLEIDNSKLYFQHQISDTQYYQLEVAGLTHVNYVYKEKTYETTLKDAFGQDTKDEQNNFIIPLHADIIRDMGVIKAHDVCYDAVRLVFNTKEKVDTGFWGSLGFKIIIFVLSVYTYGWVGALYATAFTIAIKPIIAALIKFIADYVISPMSDLLGEELTYVIAVVLAAVAVYYRVPYATELVGIAAGAVTQNMQNVAIKQIDAIQDEMRLLKEEEEELDELLSTGDNVLDLLGFNSEIDYNPITDTPGLFYDLAIHETNPGVISLDAISAFADMGLTLELPPTLIRTKVT